MFPRGAKVKRLSAPARSRLVGPSAIYSMTPCTEELARKALEETNPRPLIILELPKDKQLTPGDPEPQASEFDQDEDYCEDCGNHELL